MVESCILNNNTIASSEVYMYTLQNFLAAEKSNYIFTTGKSILGLNYLKMKIYF